jgi:hypothetical protein
LSIPGAELEALFYEGKKADTKYYEVEGDLIRWAGTDRPTEAVARIVFTKDLPKLEDDKLQLEKDKLDLEREKARGENKWKIITAIGAILSTLLTLGATTFINNNRSPTNSAQADLENKFKNDLGADTINLLNRLPPDGLDIIMAAYGTRSILMLHYQNEGYVLVNPNYDTIRRAEQLGFIDFKTPSAEFDVILSSVKPVKAKFDEKPLYPENAFSPAQKKILDQQSYGLSPKGNRVFEIISANIKEQLNATSTTLSNPHP